MVHPTLQLASTSQAKRRYRADRRHLVLHAPAVYKHSARPILQHATLDTIPMMPPPGPVQVRPLRLSPSSSFALFPSVVPSLPEVNLLRFTDLAYLHSYIRTHIARGMMSNPHFAQKTHVRVISQQRTVMREVRALQVVIRSSFHATGATRLQGPQHAPLEIGTALLARVCD